MLNKKLMAELYTLDKKGIKDANSILGQQWLKGENMLNKKLIAELYTLDKEGIKDANSILRQQWKRLHSVDVNKFDFYKGQTVSFNAKAQGILTGKIIKINRTSVKVETPIGLWNVSPSLLMIHIEDIA